MSPQTGRSPYARGVQELFDELRASGKSNAEIFEAVYHDLKQLARKLVAREPAGNSMNATRLLHDLWLGQFGRPTADFAWEDGTHFFKGMARAMRYLLIDHAQQRGAPIRGNGQVTSLDGLLDAGLEAPQDPQSKQNLNGIQQAADQALATEEAFARLEAEAPRMATIVELRVYGGLTQDETAEALGLGVETVRKDFARGKRRLADYLKTNAKDPHC